MTKLKSRITSMLLAVMMLLSLDFVPVLSFDANTYSERELVDFSQELAIFKNIGIFDINRNVHDIVTRIEFVKMLNNFFGYSETAEMLGSEGVFSDVSREDAAQIEYAVKNGYISAQDKKSFNPDGYINSAAAAQAIVCGLGYSYAAEQSYKKEENPYVSMAIKLRLFKKTNYKDAQYALTYGELLAIFKNALSVDFMYKSQGKKGVSYFISSGDNVMSEILNCTEYRGIVTATPRSDLYGGKEAPKGHIAIDNKAYGYEADITQLLGKHVRYFMKNASDDEKLLYVCEDYDKNKETVVESGDIESYKSRVYRYRNESGRLSSVTVKPGCSVIYNGRSNTVPGMNDGFNMLPRDGSVRFLDNNGDGEYDVLFIEDYETIVVGRVDSISMTLYDKNNDIRRFDLRDTYDDDGLIITTETGKCTEFKSVKIGSVVSIAMSKDEKFCRLIVSNNKIKGVIDSVSDDEIELDGNVYKINSNVLSSANVKPGKTASVSLDKNGYVAYFEAIPNATEVVYLIDAALKSKLNSKLEMKICNSSGMVEIVPVRKNVFINDKKIKVEQTALDIIKDGTSEVRPGLITISRDENGEVSRIYTVHTLSPEICPDEALMKYSEITNTSHKYMSSARSFRDFKTVLSTGCKIFVVPENPKNAPDEDFSVVSPSAFENDKFYNITTYVMGKENMLCSYAITTSSVQTSTSLLIVNKVNRVRDEDGEFYTSISGYFGSASLNYLRVYDDAGINTDSVAAFSPSVTGAEGRFSVTTGDVIHYARKNVAGKTKVTDITMLYDVETDIYMGRNPQLSEANADGNWYMADVWNINSGYAGMVLSGGLMTVAETPIGENFDTQAAANYRLDRVSSGVTLRLDKHWGKPEVLAGQSASDLVGYKDSSSDYSRVFVYTNAGVTHTCYIVK